MKIIAHRGWSAKAPENTLSAFKMALEDPGVSMMECDVHLTKDKRVVVIHDYEVNRTSNGEGRVEDFSYEALKKLDCGSWFDTSYKGSHYPLLSDLLDLIDGQKPLVIEVKKEALYYPDMAERLLEVLSTYAYKEAIYIKSFDHEVIYEISQMSSDYKLGLLYYSRPILLLEQLRACNGCFVSLYGGALSEKILEDCMKNGIEIMVWTIDKAEDVEQIWNFSEAINIITNDPAVAEKVRDRRKLDERNC